MCKAKIDFIFECLDNIKIIVKRHSGIYNALNDKVEARPAILMNLMQVGEVLNKLDTKLTLKYGLSEDVKGAYNVRNFIAHDYEGVDLALVELVIRDYLPELEKKLKIIYNEE